MTDPAGATEPHGHRVGDGLRAQLAASADADGFVSFERFMDVALYGDGVGFYTREDPPFGRTGDYYTAAHASPLFGRSVGRRVADVLDSLPSDGLLRVVELGPGDGTLGTSVVEQLARTSGTARRVEYVLVERSPTLAARAHERVSAAAGASGVRVTLSAGVGADGPFRGVVLANEVFDAQPTRRIRWDGHEWVELGVRISGDEVVPATAAPAPPVPGAPLPRPDTPGTILEVSPAAEGLVREVADHLTDGLFVALDYGMEETELLAAHPSGTVASVRHHRTETDPLAHPGDSDLSVFVNFTRIRAAATRAGWAEVAFRRQAEALGAWGFPALMEESVRSAASSEEEVRVRLSAKNLLFGFERFYALELAPQENSPARPGLT